MNKQVVLCIVLMLITVITVVASVVVMLRMRARNDVDKRVAANNAHYEAIESVRPSQQPPHMWFPDVPGSLARTLADEDKKFVETLMHSDIINSDFSKLSEFARDMSQTHVNALADILRTSHIPVDPVLHRARVQKHLTALFIENEVFDGRPIPDFVRVGLI